MPMKEHTLECKTDKSAKYMEVHVKNKTMVTQKQKKLN